MMQGEMVSSVQAIESILKSALHINRMSKKLYRSIEQRITETVENHYLKRTYTIHGHPLCHIKFKGDTLEYEILKIENK